MLDAGTTTFELAILLYNLEGHTIITNDIMIAKLLYNSNNIIYFLGGLIDPNSGSSTNTYAQQMLGNFNIDIAFLVAASISADNILETSD